MWFLLLQGMEILSAIGRLYSGPAPPGIHKDIDLDRLQTMRVFTRIVEANSFGKAAATLGLPHSTVTRAIKELEAQLGVRLLQRTTRHLSLTPDGNFYFEHCRRLLAELDAVEAGFPGSDGRPRGKLRVDTTASFARMFIVPVLSEFQVRYPDIELHFSHSDRTVDLVQEGIDCVIRAGVPQDSATLVARRIASFEWVTCAAPSYLRRHGEPRSLDDLQRHHAIGYTPGHGGRSLEWTFVVNGEEVRIRPPERLAMNDTDVYLGAGLEGLGLIRAGSHLVLPHLRAGTLRRVLPEYTAPAVPISIMFPRNRHLAPAVRAFADWIAGTLQHSDLRAP
jgi:LysR family transcriptional regulator for bpeEF and oprC